MFKSDLIYKLETLIEIIETSEISVLSFSNTILPKLRVIRNEIPYCIGIDGEIKKQLLDVIPNKHDIDVKKKLEKALALIDASSLKRRREIARKQIQSVLEDRKRKKTLLEKDLLQLSFMKSKPLNKYSKQEVFFLNAYQSLTKKIEILEIMNEIKSRLQLLENYINNDSQFLKEITQEELDKFADIMDL